MKRGLAWLSKGGEGIREFFAPTYNNLTLTPREFFLGHEGYDHQEGWSGDDYNGEEASYRPPFLGGIVIYTGEDVRAGRCGADEDIRYWLEPDHLLEGIHCPVNPDTRDVAVAYLDGDGMDAVIDLFREANWQSEEGKLLRHAILNFCDCLRRALAEVSNNGAEPIPEMDKGLLEMIISRANGTGNGRPSWWYCQLGKAILGEEYFNFLAKKAA